MKIEIRNTRINLSVSQETINFSAYLFVDGIKVAICENGGYGGSTLISSFDEKTQRYVNEAEEYCKTLPSVKAFGTDLPMNLEFFVDLLVEKEVKEKERKSFEKKIMNATFKSVVYGVKGSGSFRMAGYPGKPLHELSPELLKSLVDGVKKKLKPGETIFNTNI